MVKFSLIVISFLLVIAMALFCAMHYMKRVIFPLLILFIGNALFLYAKFAVGDSFLSLIYYLPATALVVIAIIWFIIFLIAEIRKSYNKNLVLAIFSSFAITALILLIPPLNKEDKYNLYRNDYLDVSDAIFQSYDEGKIYVTDQFHSPPYSRMDMEKIESLYTDDVIKKMKKLNKHAGVYSYILADQDVIYFSFGAVLQSISGIAITRNGRELSTNDELSTRFFDGATSYEYVEDDVYYFYDGL